VNTTDTAPVALGIDVGGTKLVAASVAADGTLVDRRRAETPARDGARLVRTVADLIVELDGGQLPVGIGVAGMVTPGGTVRYGPNIGVRDLDLPAELATATEAPIVVVNDANAAALGEQRVGAGAGHHDLVLFTLGTGVGGGLVLRGQVQLGANGFAGELGHLVVAEGGRPCPCGNRGCIEAYASGTAIGLQARDRLIDPEVRSVLRDDVEMTGRSVTDAAVDGDELAQAVLGDVGHWLGVAAASVVNAVDPEVVLVGGGAGRATAPWVLPAASRSMAARVLGGDRRPLPPIELTALGDDAGMIGAALLAAERAGTAATPAAPATATETV
jgi:glucokinase